MEPLRVLRSRFVLLPIDDADTDQIIPARFLKTTSRAGLGAHLFADRRGPQFPLDQPEARGASVLVVGRNFGCGSSREHAPWALADAGFRAIIALSVADIFRANAIKNGIVPVVVERPFYDQLCASLGAEVTIDLESLTVTVGEKRATTSFSLDPFARHCLVSGVDELGLLLGKLDAIAAYEKNAETLS